MSLAFLVTSLVVVVTPGTGALFTIAAGLHRGARASIVAAVGCTLGVVPHLAAAITGTAALLRASGLAFEVLKIAGVAYLLYLAVSTWRDSGLLQPPIQPPKAAATPVSDGRVISSAVLVNLLNPKLTLFFLAFLPQFVHPEQGSVGSQLTVLGLTFVTMSAVYTALIALAAGHVVGWIARHRGIGRWQGRVIGAIYLGLGVRLALQER